MTDGIAGVGKRLTAERERKGWSKGALADRALVATSTISRIENGKVNPDLDTLERIAAALGIPLESLTGARTPVPSSEAFGAFARVPVVRAVHAGDQSLLQQTGNFEWVPADVETGRSLLASTVVGDCLAPKIEPGDMVLYDTRRRDPQHGEIVVITTPDGELLTKRAVRGPDGALWLADNRGGMEQPDGAKLEGVVIRIIKIPTRGDS